MVSLRKLALTLTMTVLISVTLFPSYVKADVQQTSEFVEPVKNWSFEEIGLSVCECPPWTSNYGGWRALRSDVNEDGKVNSADAILIGQALFTEPVDPKYNPNADLNGDHRIRSNDLIIWGQDLYKEMGVDAFCLDGDHSWYTNGEGDYYMYQELDSDTINAVKGKQVAFSFWFLPEYAASDGSQNYARAGIHYLSYGYPYANSWIYGDWVHPNEMKWHTASVTAGIPDYADYVEVVIQGTSDGTPDFKAWIDYTSLSAYSSDWKSFDNDFWWVEGTVTVSANIFQLYEITPEPPEWAPDCKAYLSVAVGVERHHTEPPPGYDESPVCIRGVELNVKLLTDGYLHIYYCEQSNDRDVEVDPEKQEEFQNQVLLAAGTTISAGIGVATFFLPVAAPLKPVISVTSGFFGTLILQRFASDSLIESANGVGEYVRERWMYGYLLHYADGSYGLTLEFFKGNTAQIEVTAKVYWGIGYPLNTQPFAETEVSTIVTVNL